MSDKHYKPLGSQAIGVGDEIWGTCEACNELNRLTRELAEAKASLHNAEKAAMSLSWAKAKAENERNDMFCQLTAANATIAACKEAAENAIDYAENAMEQGDADEAWARCNAGLRDVIAAAKEAQ